MVSTAKYALNQVPEDLLNPSYWQSICPDLHVCNPAFFPSDPPSDFSVDWDDTVIEGCRQRLIDEGFFTLDVHSAVSEELIANTRAGILALVEAGWHPNFIAIFDEPWRIAHAVGAAFHRITGGNSLNFDWLAYFVPRESAGMPPHRDFTQSPAASWHADGTPCVVTCWISLGFSGPDNSCLYVLPKTADPRYSLSSSSEKPADVFSDPTTYQHIRAVPLGPGEAVTFSHRVYHWGSASTPDAVEPRVAIAVGFSDPAYKAPYLPSSLLPSPPFGVRVALASAQMLIYSYRLDGPWPLTDDFDLDIRTLAFLYDIYKRFRTQFDPTFHATVERSPILKAIQKLVDEKGMAALVREAHTSLVVVEEAEGDGAAIQDVSDGKGRGGSTVQAGGTAGVAKMMAHAHSKGGEGES